MDDFTPLTPHTPSDVIAGAILAGGAASRFGGLPKGLQIVGGYRIIDRVARVLRPATDRLVVVSNDRDAVLWLSDAEVVGDVLDRRASLVGIHSAIARAQSDVIVVAWDMPFVSADLLVELRRRVRAGVTAVIPTGPGGPEPACAAYSTLAVSHLALLIGAGELRLTALATALPDVDLMPVTDVARFGDPGVMFFNVNRPEDLVRAEAIATAL